MSKQEIKAKLVIGLNNVSNREYHSDKEFWSSTPLKQILKNSEQFYNDYILGKKVQEHKSAFDEGSYVHSLLLEPELVAEQYAIYDGIKRGDAFDRFKADNSGLTVLSKSQVTRCLAWAEAAKANKAASQLLSGGKPEFTIAGVLEDVKVKVRTDYINFEKGYIADVKTTGDSTGPSFFSATVDRFQYDLSAALYTAVAEQHFGQKFDFYYITISKSDGRCQVYKTSETTAKMGKSKLKFALERLKECQQSGDWSHIDWEPETELFDVLEI
jgi:hypothetical protein